MRTRGVGPQVKVRKRQRSKLEATLMRLIGVISTAVLSLILAAPVYAQEQHDQQEEKAKPEERKAQPEKTAKPQEEKRAQPERSAKPEEKSSRQQNKNNQQEEKNAQQQNKN